MFIEFEKLNDNSKEPYRKIDNDYCYDLYATSKNEIKTNVFEYGLGIRIKMKRTWWMKLLGNKIRLSLDVRPRSSVWKTGMILSGCTGTIDELYRGEMKAIFYKVAEGDPYEIGDRIVQCKIGIAPNIKWIESNHISTDTERGDKGFGHSGRN